MVSDTHNPAVDILSKPYWHFHEIVDLAVSRRFMEDSENNRAEEIAKFKVHLLRDLNEAILSRVVVPVDLVKAEGWLARNDHLLEPGKILGLALAAITLGYVGQRVLSSSPEVLKEFKKGYDPSHFFVDLLVRQLVGTVLIAVIVWLAFLVVRGAKARSKTTRGRIEYLMSDAEIRGFTDQLYESESVIDFLNKRYSLKIGKDPFRVWQEPFFKRNGDMWIVGYLGKRLCFKEKAGHEAIAYLLSRPGEAFDCRLFVKGNPDDIGKGQVNESGSTNFDEYAAFCQKIRAEKSDKQAIESMLQFLNEGLEETRSDGRTEDVDRYTDQIKMLERYLHETYTKGGEEKPPRDDATRARDAIKKAIERCIGDFKKDHPFFAEHLSKNITRSYSLSYNPQEEIRWDVLY